MIPLSAVIVPVAILSAVIECAPIRSALSTPAASLSAVMLPDSMKSAEIALASSLSAVTAPAASMSVVMLPASMKSEITRSACSLSAVTDLAASLSVVISPAPILSAVMAYASITRVDTQPVCRFSSPTAPPASTPGTIDARRMLPPSTSGTCQVAIFRLPVPFWRLPSVTDSSSPVSTLCRIATTSAA